jgi:anti-sigma factor RsiW
MTDTWTDRLSEYVDGDLDAATRSELERHLAACADCRATVDELQRVVARAKRVPYREPSSDLWAPIAATIERSRVATLPTAPRRKLTTRSIVRLAVAASIVTQIAGGLGWYIASRRAAERSPVAMTPDSASAQVAASVPAASGLAVASYRDAAADLERVLEAGRATLRPETMRIIEENLRTIDVAIAQADSALRRDPGSEYLNQYLATTMQRKLKLLRRAVEITQARS